MLESSTCFEIYMSENPGDHIKLFTLYFLGEAKIAAIYSILNEQL